MKRTINYNQPLFSIVNDEIAYLFHIEDIYLEDEKEIISRIADLFFKTIGIRDYNKKEQLQSDIQLHIKTPIILAKTYAHTHNVPDNHFILKAIDSMQIKIKNYRFTNPQVTDNTITS